MARSGVRLGLAVLSCLIILGGLAAASAWASGEEAREASPKTKQMNSRLPESLPEEDWLETEMARFGAIADPPVEIRTRSGEPVWDLKPFEFLDSDGLPPDTVNPALWRHAKRNMIHGLFRVTDGIYQVRGFDLANITFIEGKTGVIVVDPLMSVESARAALELFYENLPRRPVTAVIYTHSHVDHWGGVKGVVSGEDVRTGKVRIIAPEGLTSEAISENVLAGNAMARRATYMFGTLLPKGPRGQVDAGIGKAASTGTVSFIAPTEEVTKPVQEMTIDGVRFVFQLVPGTEAPAEMNFYLPEWKALCIAENAAASLHNLLTPRGALVRDGRAWARSIDEALDLFGEKTEVFFSTHLWPRIGKARIAGYLRKQRDLYKYIHDQTVRLMNQGYPMAECAERIQLPPSLAREWYNRDFYGTVNFNVKAVYQRYLGWFDGNPANLHPLPPEEAARRYVEYMGGAKAVLARAKEAMEKGDYRWVAQVVNHVVYAEPGNSAARGLQADALEQLGYQAESPVWRNFYLSGAKELREGVQKSDAVQTGNVDVIRSMPLDTFFDLMAVRLNGPKAADKRITLNWVFTDTNQKYALTLENGVLHHKSLPAAAPDATVILTRSLFDSIAAKETTFTRRILAGDIRVEGKMMAFLEMMSCLDEYEFWFPVVTPAK